MADRPRPSLEQLRAVWRRTPFHGGLLGIASVALATVAIGAICALIAVVVTAVY